MTTNQRDPQTDLAGVVIEVRVAVGDVVPAGQPLVVIEAMEERKAGIGTATAAAPEGASTRRFRTFDSLLDVPAFRWYLLSMTGNWSAMQMQQVARSYLAYQITGSFAALGLVELANTWPRLFLSLYGGVVADRASRRVIIQIGQGFNALNAGVIATLLFTGRLEFWHLIMMSFFQGILNSFVLPARQAMIPEIVGPQRLMNAFALNVFIMNVMRLGAPAIAGAIIAAMMLRSGGNLFLSVGVVFTIMTLLNVVAVAGMFPVPKTNAATRARLRGETSPETAWRGRDRLGFGDIKDGIAYLRREKIIIWLMVIHASTQTLAQPYQRMLPGFVEQVLGASPGESAAFMGLLLTMTAVGALVGALVIASMPDRQRGKLLAFSLALFGITLIAFASSTVFWISAGIVVVLGIGQSLRQSIANVLIQSRVDEAYRGRVSAMMHLDDGLESLGVFGIAMLADFVGAQWTLAAVGALMVVYGGVIWGTKTIRNLD